MWNAAICNLRRRVEAYSVELFVSVIKDEAGRKQYKTESETLAGRWQGVDDLVLIEGATRLGLLNKKGGKALEMINWMRNHASPAHPSEDAVTKEDVMALVLMIEKNLFEAAMPEIGHSVAGLFEPIKESVLAEPQLDLLRAQIDGLRTADVRTAFGFMLDVLVGGIKPAVQNVKVLFPALWQRSPDELRKTAGLKYQALLLDAEAENDAKDRLLEFLVEVRGIKFMPEASRAAIYKKAAKKLAIAKDTSYGWDLEHNAAKVLAQFGAHVPGICFEEVYQEILAVCCGNFWGRSGANSDLEPFIFELDSRDLRQIVQMFMSNERVRSELFQLKPQRQARELLLRIKDELTLQAHKAEVDEALEGLP